MLNTTPNVSDVKVSTSRISGEVELVAGTNITLTPSGQQITIAASGGGSGITIGTTTVTSGTASRVLYEGTGNVVQEDSTFSFDDTNNILFVPEIAGGSTTSSNLMVSAYSNAYSDTNTGRIQLMERVTFDGTVTVAGASLSSAFITGSGTITSSVGINIFSGFNWNPTIRYSLSQTFSASPAFQAGVVYQPTTAVTDSATFTQWMGFSSAIKFSPDIASGTATTPLLLGYNAGVRAGRTNAGTTVITTIAGFGTYQSPVPLTNDIDTVTATDLIHFLCGSPFTGAFTLTNQKGIYIPNFAVGTNRYGYYSDLAANANYWSIYSNGDAQSAHKGLFKIGDMVAPTALMHTKGSTTARASVRVEAGTAPTTPNSGDLWHDSTRQCFMVYCGGMTLGIQKVGFAETANANINTSTTETTLLGTGVGTATLAANFLTVGKTIKVRMWGFYGTKASPVGALTIRFKYGSTTLVTLSPTLTVSLTNQAFNVEFELTCRTTGATGTVFAQGEGKFYSAAGTAGLISGVTTATTTIDTTASSKIDVTAQWATSNASNTITSTNYSMEVLY